MLITALQYARKGMKIIPIAKNGKIPILPDWVNKCSSDPDTIRNWFEGNELNVGIVTGKKSNILVIDIDIKNGDGRMSMADFEAKTGSYLPPTVTAKTPSGGIHLFFKYPSEVSNIKGKIGILPNVDIRADGNQVVVYPSKGDKGNYTWIHSPWEHNLAQLPKIWKQFICGEVTDDEIGKIKIPKRPFKLPDNIPSGLRHATLLSYACSLSGKSSIGERELTGSVKEANNTICNPPLGEEEVNKIIEWAVDKIGKKEIVIDDDLPDWIIVNDKGVKSIDDGVFVAQYKKEKSLVCINSIFYNDDGYVESAWIKNDIQKLIKYHVTASLAPKVNTLFESLKNECFFDPPIPNRNIVHLNNTTLKVTESGVYEVSDRFTLNRLHVDYVEEEKSPIWNTFLLSLFHEDDIVTLQEYVGYCLVPTTIAQKALIMTGKGGEGKSVVGEVLQAIFKNSMVQGELHKLQENRFMMAQLENKLLFYDDDLQSSALTDTGTFKKLVTATIPVLVERKGEPHYEMLPYARILASGNKGLEACYDHTEGFYRRLILLRCKEKDKNRKDDKLLAKKIIKNELEGILNWAIRGLQRLMNNGWEFTISDKTQEAILDARRDGNSIIPFTEDLNTLIYDDDEEITSSDLYDAYEMWCEDNAMKPLAMRTVSNYFRENAKELGITYSNRVKGKRGYIGVGLINKVTKGGRFKLVKGGEA